jgi:flagellar biosynthesis component FlhA
MATLVLVSFAANLIHWRGRKDERFFHYPQSRWLRLLFNSAAVAVIATAVLFLFHVIPALPFLIAGFVLTLAQQFYSIAHRRAQRQRACPPDTAAVARSPGGQSGGS